jgi:hypothetical protein
MNRLSEGYNHITSLSNLLNLRRVEYLVELNDPLNKSRRRSDVNAHNPQPLSNNGSRIYCNLNPWCEQRLYQISFDKLNTAFVPVRPAKDWRISKPKLVPFLKEYLQDAEHSAKCFFGDVTLISSFS